MQQLSFFDAPGKAEAAEIRRLIAAGFLFVLNHSGGKDSQAMYLTPRSARPRSAAYCCPCDFA